MAKKKKLLSPSEYASQLFGMGINPPVPKGKRGKRIAAISKAESQKGSPSIDQMIKNLHSQGTQFAGGTSLRSQYNTLIKKLNLNVAQASNLYMIANQVGIDPLYFTQYAAMHGIAGSQDVKQLLRVAYSERARAQSNGGVYRTSVITALAHNGVKDAATILKKPKFTGTYGQPYRLANGKRLIVDGAVVTKIQFNQFSQKYGDVWRNFTGKSPSEHELVNLLKNPISSQQLITQLAHKPGFFSSPAYQKIQPVFATLWQQVYGTTKNLPRQLVRKAIVNQWNQSEFIDTARQLPQYKQSLEYKTNFAQYSNTYQQIYGQWNHHAHQIVTNAVNNRWTGPQFEAWLRSRPEYAHSAEQHGLADQLAQQFGTVITSSKKYKRGEQQWQKPAGSLLAQAQRQQA